MFKHGTKPSSILLCKKVMSRNAIGSTDPILKIL